MKEPLSIAVIGLGKWGTNIIRTLDSFPGCRVRYKATRNYPELLSKDDIDAVIIATPGTTHADISIPFLEKGIPVFIETPFATSIVDARRIAAAARAHNASVNVGHLHLHNPAYRAFKEALPKIGKIRLLVGEGASMGPFRADMSVLWDSGPHDVAMMIDLLGHRPKSVQAWGECVVRTTQLDMTEMRLAFKGGVIGIARSSVVSSQKRRVLAAHGEYGMVVFDDAAEQKVALHADGDIVHVEYGTTSPLASEMTAFLSSIKANEQDTTDVALGIDVVSVLAAADESIQKGGKVVTIRV
jgi:UDP-N-acetylglucosamine 3-dehydrogenase